MLRGDPDARALESRSADSILKDESAENLIQRIEYDFGKFTITKDDTVTAAIWVNCRSNE